MMIIPRFTPRHARSVASCASSFVKSHVSSNNGNSSQRSCRPQRSSRPCFRVAILTEDLCSFRWSDALGEHRLRRLGVQYHAIEKPFRNVERLRHLFSRFHFVYESKGRKLVLRPLSGFINQLEAGVLVHALELLLHLWGTVSRRSQWKPCSRRHPRNSPWSASRTSHASRLRSSGSIARRAFPVKTLLRRGLYHRAPVFVWIKGAFDFDRSLACGRK